MPFDFDKEIGQYMDAEIDSWFDQEYLQTIAEEITTLVDYVPKDIEKKLPDYEKRRKFIAQYQNFLDSDYYQLTQIANQMAGGRTWGEHVGIYDDFFRKHPEYSKLIKDEEAYRKWRLEIPFYYTDSYYEKRFPTEE